MKKKANLALTDNTAALYARLSSHNQREENIDAQVRACREYAERNGLNIIKIYSNHAKNGTNADREKF